MQKGDIPKKGEAGEVADDMKKTDVKKMAKTKHKGLPRKVKKESISITTLKEMVKEEFTKIIKEAKSVDKIKKDLIKTIDALKKNFPIYKAAKESGDEKKYDKYKKIALKLTKLKKKLETEMDKALGTLHSDAELELEGKLNELDAEKSKMYVSKAFKQINNEMFKFRHAMGVKQLSQADPKLKKQLESLQTNIFALQKELQSKGLTEGKLS